MINGNVFKFAPDWQKKGLAVVGVELPLKGDHLVFPDSYEGKPVREIHYNFCPESERGKIVTVTIPDSIILIDSFAFSNFTNLQQVNLSAESHLGTIGKYAFSECESLRSFYAPETLTAILASAFQDCTSLESFHIGERILLLGEDAFRNCTNLRSLTFDKDCCLPEIKWNTFWGCESLTSVVIPRDIELIRQDAFAACSSLRSVRFAEGSELEDIYWNAFVGCPALTEISFANCKKLKKIGEFAFYNSTNLKSVEFAVGSDVKLDKDAFAKGVKKINYKSKGCYVATCVYGSYDCAQVWTLRRFRDLTLSKTTMGRAFIRLYYAVSPTVVRLFGRTRIFGRLFRPFLDRMVSRLNNAGYEDTPYND